MSKFIVLFVLNESKSATSLCKLDLSKKENLIKKPDRFGATSEIHNLLKKDAVTYDSAKVFKKNYVVFLSSMVTKLKDRSPLKCAVVRNDASISPMLIATNRDWSKVFFKNFLERIV